MLMLGESVLSLLVTDGTGRDYLAIFYAGVITVVLLQILHFRSQPRDPDTHAMRRSKNAGVMSGFLFQLYSVALVAVGVTYKLLLYGSKDDETEKGGGSARFLLAEEARTQKRWLAPASDGDDPCGPTEAERAALVAHLFSGAMAVTFLCLDLMVLNHVGLKTEVDKVGRYSVVNTNRASGIATVTTKDGTNTKGIFFVLLPRVLITVFVATLGLWQQEPRRLAELGCAVVIGQLITRLLGDVFFPAQSVSGKTDHDLHATHGVDDEDSGVETE